MFIIQDKLHGLQQQINQLCEKYKRDANSITLLAVSKKHNIASIQQAIDAGQQDFGESYLQEALIKINHFTNLNYHLNWHFIGPIQSNKTKQLANNFSWIHSVDRLTIAERLNNQRCPNLPALNICIQVNIDNEPQKAGVSLEALTTLATSIQQLPRLSLRGLMAIPKAIASVKQQRDSFKRLHDAANALQLTTLSMGMSNDIEAAIAEGATIIRLGTAIFGARNDNE